MQNYFKIFLKSTKRKVWEIKDANYSLQCLLRIPEFILFKFYDRILCHATDITIIFRFLRRISLFVPRLFLCVFDRKTMERRTKSCVCILIHLPLSTAIDLIAIRVLLKWIIVCHHKISTRFKSRTAHWWSIDSFLPSLRSFPFVPRVRFFLFFFSFPKFLIKSIGDISGKNFLSKKKTLSFPFIRKRVFLFSSSSFFNLDVTKIYSKILVYNDSKN